MVPSITIYFVTHIICEEHIDMLFFPICQVRVVCYMSTRALLLLLLLLVLCAVLNRGPRLVVFPADLNCEGRVAAFPSRPQPQVQDGVLRRTSTAGSGWQCSPSDFNQHTTTNTQLQPHKHKAQTHNHKRNHNTQPQRRMYSMLNESKNIY